MSEVIRIPSALYDRLAKLATGFDTPANVIERLLDNYNGKPVSTSTTPQKPRKPVTGRPEVVFFPDGVNAFKSALLKHKAAWVLLHNADGTSELHHWNASRFKYTSDLWSNLNSGYLINWRDKSIVKCEIAINREDLSIVGDKLM